MTVRDALIVRRCQIITSAHEHMRRCECVPQHGKRVIR